jgi:uncharacterized ion transporter superfamily protein YfcC
MTTLFFVLGIVFIVYELSVLKNPSTEAKFIDKLRKDKDYFSSDNLKVTKDERNKGCIIVFSQMFYFVWSILGILMATQWKSFAFIFAVSIIAGLLSKIYQKLDLYGKPLHLFTKRIDSLVCIILIVDIVWLHFREFSILNYLFGI